MNTPPKPLVCGRCGRRLDPGVLAGLCGYCLTALSIDGNANDFPVFGEYELLEELGRGGMGVVYYARQRGLDRLVAVKMVLAGAYAGPAAEERLMLEARSAARLKHPNIVAIHQVGRHEGKPFYSMELIEGEDLAKRVTGGTLSTRQIATIVAKAARAVQHAHEQGVLHRDLKPANLLIDVRGEPILTDFGLVASVDGSSGFTRTGEIMGSPGFMAPEQLQGKASVATDVYGLGAVLYFSLTKRAPFVAAQLAELLEAVGRGDVVAPRRLDASIPVDLETITLRALSYEPSRRYPSAAALADDLERWLAGMPIQARPLNSAQHLSRWAKRNPALSVSFVALVLAIFLGGIGVTYQWRRAQRAAETTRVLLYSADLKAASDALLVDDVGFAERTLQNCPLELRDTAWGLLWPRVHGDVDAVFGEARWTITSLSVSPDGRLAASAAHHDLVQLWDIAERRRIAELPSTEDGSWTEFSPDGAWVFSGTEAGKVTQWSVSSRAKIREYPGQTGQVSPDGKRLYTCIGQRFVFAGQPGEVDVWNVVDGSLQFRIPVSGRLIALSHNGNLLAVSDAFNSVAVYDAHDGHPVIPPWSCNGQLWDLDFSNDDKILVGSGWTKFVRIWDLQQAGSPPRELEHGSNVWGTAFSPDGKTLAVGCSDRQVYLWNTSTWKLSRKLRGHHDEVWSIAWVNDGKLLSSGRDPRVLQWDLTRAPALSHLRHEVNTFNITWLSEGRLATVHRRSEGLGTCIASPQNTAEQFFVDETPIAFDAKTNHLWLWHGSGELRVRDGKDLSHFERVPWETFPGEERTEIPRIEFAASVAWTTLRGGALIVHRLQDGRRIARYDNIHAVDAWASALSPDGAHFVWSGEAEKLYITHLRTGQQQRLEGHGYYVSSTVFSPHGKWFVTGGVDGKLLMWDTERGTLRRQLGQHTTSVGRMAISADSKTLISHEIERGVRIWDTDTFREVGMIEALDTELEHWLGLSPDGRWLGLRRSDGVIQIYPIARPDGTVTSSSTIYHSGDSTKE